MDQDLGNRNRDHRQVDVVGLHVELAKVLAGWSFRKINQVGGLVPNIIEVVSIEDRLKVQDHLRLI